MKDLPDEARAKELGYFFFYSPVPFVVKPSQALLDRLGVGPNSQGMLGDLP
jgi:hypothetical protein